MTYIIDIALKDLLQFVRDRKTFLFLLIMPVAFTLLFGFASGAFQAGGRDSRLPVGYLDEDKGNLSRSLHELLAASEVIRLVENPINNQESLEALVADEKLAAAIVIPEGYTRALMQGKSLRIILFADEDSSAGTTVENEALSAAIRLESAVRLGIILEDEAGAITPFEYTFDKSLSSWQDPPIKVLETTSTVIAMSDNRLQSLAHTSPGMMLQFAVANLLTSGGILVNERKVRALQRLFTTAVSRNSILLGHYLAIFVLLMIQSLLLITFGQLALGLNYFPAPVATLLIIVCSTTCLSAFGLLIGVLARSEDQAIVFSIVSMFIFAGMGGAWVPLEVTHATFQIIGHLSPIAWALDGYKDILLRGYGWQAVLLPCLALVIYAGLFFFLASWKFYKAEEQ